MHTIGASKVRHANRAQRLRWRYFAACRDCVSSKAAAVLHGAYNSTVEQHDNYAASFTTIPQHRPSLNQIITQSRRRTPATHTRTYTHTHTVSNNHALNHTQSIAHQTSWSTEVITMHIVQHIEGSALQHNTHSKHTEISSSSIGSFTISHIVSSILHTTQRC